MQLAAYVPVVHLLRAAGVGIVIVSTSSPRYSASFAAHLGFDVPGVVAVDTKRHTHRAAGLRSSVYASLVMPFKKHLATFGAKALVEALRVSLVNATRGHGSSWQQGATLVLRHPQLRTGGAAECAWAWREDYPGDWQPVHTILADALGIADAPVVDFPERLDYVIACRNERRAHAGEGAGKGKKRPLPAASDECTDEACSIDAVRRKAKASMGTSNGTTHAPTA